MQLEKQVVSLELAKRLKELGVWQKSLFSYAFETDQILDNIDGEPLLGDNYACAFTVAELFKICYDQGIEYQIEETLQAEQIADYLAEKICKSFSELSELP